MFNHNLHFVFHFLPSFFLNLTFLVENVFCFFFFNVIVFFCLGRFLLFLSFLLSCFLFLTTSGSAGSFRWLVEKRVITLDAPSLAQTWHSHICTFKFLELSRGRHCTTFVQSVYVCTLGKYWKILVVCTPSREDHRCFTVVEQRKKPSTVSGFLACALFSLKYYF